MMGRSHLVIATATAGVGVALAGTTTTTAAVVVGGAMVTAKLPDVDIKLGIRHRGVTHTLIACVLITGAVGFGLSMFAATAPYAMAAALGVLTGVGMHLVADACTPRGVAVFAPLSNRDVHLLPGPLLITTGSWQETAVVAVGAVGAAFLTAHVLGAL